MITWLRLILMIFHAPLRGMREVRDRASLAPISLLAYISQVAYSAITKKFSGSLRLSSVGTIAPDLFQAAMTIVMLAIVLVPLVTLLANMFDRRGSFRVVLTQEYAPVTSTVFYVLLAANIGAILIAVFLHYSGIQGAYIASTIQQADQIRTTLAGSPQWDAIVTQQLGDPVALSEGFFRLPKLALFSVGVVLAVKESFRLSFMRALGITVLTYLGILVISPLWALLFSRVLGSPFLLFLVFMLLRGYFSDFIGQHRARAAFKQNLEAATLNPADASAHYNLGLIHQNRGELEAAKERYERAIQIDQEEIDSYYQLGRIARQQKRFGDAIQNFEQVVLKDPAHSQYEIWREVAATYISAGQFEDARNALEQFLEHRPSDPEGLYLMGRAHAGLGHNREAASLMQACIEAVKTAPAYKYRTSKRWMNEAQQFIKSGQ
jgi:tetratricopeptide (TPR) repeat protein